MTSGQIHMICGLLIASVGILLLPFLIGLVRRIAAALSGKRRGSTGFGKQLLTFSGFLILSIWCLRYAVGCYLIYSAETGAVTLTWWEEIFNSTAHALQTFSMDEDYTQYILDGKRMLREMAGPDTGWATAYGLYASALNFIAPIAGGAIIFEILASIFPRLKLRLSYWAFWREKFFFSELNERSLALVKSLCDAHSARACKPVIIVTDAYVNNEEEKGAELMQEAKRCGAICVRDDLSHVAKNRYGKRSFFLMDESEAGNLQTLTKLADAEQYMYLHQAEINLFTRSDAYVQIERQLRDKLRTVYGVPEEALPVVCPVQGERNLVSNLLVELPLYEPLVGRKREADGTLRLHVTILGTGSIGTEMFLSAYWFGQMLDTTLSFHIVSQESEADFRGRIDYINPEILRTTVENDPILRYNRRGDCAEPYCTVQYTQCDVRSSDFIRRLSEGQPDTALLESDYVLVALGSDAENLSVAKTMRNYIGQHHIAVNAGKRTVIAYVVEDAGLSDILNRSGGFCAANESADLYMRAIGSLQEVYSVKNIFMTEQALPGWESEQVYLSKQNRAVRAKTHTKRLDDDYKYWANLARGMHLKYKLFSLGLVRTSVFDVTGGVDDPAYVSALREAYAQYRRMVEGEISLPDAEAKAKQIERLHRLAWLEHRRWNAFTRVKGFRQTDAYETYYQATGSYKHMELRLHPCLVECDKAGIRADIDEKCNIDQTTAFRCSDPEALDLLDEVSYRLYALGYNDYDFKVYDYPR